MISILARSLLIIFLFGIPLFVFKWSADIEAVFKRLKGN
jgi:hypothetical protein